MRHWTQDGAHVAALVALAAGVVFVAMATNGATMSAALLLSAFALGALVTLRALETRDGWRQATDALAKVQAHEERLAKVEKEAEEARKRAVSAQVAANARGAVQRQDF